MNRLLICLIGMLTIVNLHAQELPIKREMRGAWIATFSSIDWPNRSQTAAQQRASLISILEHHRQTGMNTIYLQVRSQCDAMYPSSIEPWSADLKGTQGIPPSPLWDPLQFAIEETHKRGMELHAWINPYRAVATASNLSGFVSSHVAKQHPEWLLNNGSTITLNPGIPQVRDYIMSVISDILTRYDIDGIHFDDYFYPPAPFNDDAAFNADPRGFTVRADWRRDNVNMLIQRVYSTVLSTKPWVKFGVSPSGIYRSSTNPSIGSNTSSGANQHYSSVYADSKRWLQEGWVDYIEPQVYWYIGQTGSDYNILVPWWNNNSFGRHIYIGMAGYKVNDPAMGPFWAQPTMIPREMRLNRGHANISGQAIYNTNALRSTTKLGFRDSLRLFFYQKPALLPTMPWRDNIPPESPSVLVAERQADGVLLNWENPPVASNELDQLKRIVVYRSSIFPVDIDDANNILAVTPNDTTAFKDLTALAGEHYFYTITGIDRFHNESATSNTVADVLPSISCPTQQVLISNNSCSAILPDYVSLVTGNGGNITQSPVAGTLVTTGSHVITMTVTNAAGQAVNCTFNVLVKDEMPPVITACAPNKIIGTDPGVCSAIVITGLPIATDNCGVSTISGVRQDGKPLDAPYPTGTTIINWTVQDAAGNSTTCVQHIIVRDEAPPVITECPSTIIAVTDPGSCSATVTPGIPKATDNCGISNITGIRQDNKPIEAPYPKGTTFINWSVQDVAGNTTTCVQKVVVSDQEPPVIANAFLDIVSLWPANHKMKKVNVYYEVADNCGLVTTTISVSSNEPVNGTGDGDTDPDWEILNNHAVRLRAERSGSGTGRVYTIIVTATDASGNESTKTLTVTVPHDHNDVTARQGIGNSAEENQLAVTITPNPTRTQFVVRTATKATSIRVLDVNGKFLEVRKNVPAGVLYIGGKYPAGVYFLEITVGASKEVIKLVKQ